MTWLLFHEDEDGMRSVYSVRDLFYDPKEPLRGVNAILANGHHLNLKSGVAWREKPDGYRITYPVTKSAPSVDS